MRALIKYNARDNGGGWGIERVDDTGSEVRALIKYNARENGVGGELRGEGPDKI